MSQSSTTHYPFTIDHLARDDNGYWTATLIIYGEPIAVDCTQGSWRYTPASKGRWQELELRYATALEKQIGRLERAERRDESR